MVKYLKNRGNLYYKIVKYVKATDTLKLIDPHTHKQFQVTGVADAIRLGEFKIVKRESEPR